MASHFSKKNLMQIQMERRDFCQQSVTVSLLGFIGGSLTGCVRSQVDREGVSHPLGIKSIKTKLPGVGVPVIKDPQFDSVVVPKGYQAKVFFSWGDPVENHAPLWKGDGTETWQEQQLQAGQNHDGMHFFSIDHESNHGLLVVNHEYINPSHLHPNGPVKGKKRSLDEIKKEQAAHGISIIEIKKRDGIWNIISPSTFARRIHGNTEMEIRGPAAGVEAMKTADDPHGHRVLGTFNNCAMGYTPWGTYLACEENFPNYFVNTNPSDRKSRREHHRYGIKKRSQYGWETSDPRFDATADPSKPFGGQVNEPNRFGWVVEIDPFDRRSKPIKRTAMGRLVRECATPFVAPNGDLAFYMGDDSKGEYVYKFVPSSRYKPNDQESNKHLLDSGALLVAVFHDDGTGTWKELAFGHHGLTPENGFRSQADILINARSAADHVAATPMDRPEWVAVHPQTKSIYVTLTNNTQRGVNHQLNQANPRSNNQHGHILRFSEQDNQPSARSFSWEIYLFGGHSEKKNTHGDIHDDIFSCPDGLYFDSDGRLWIQTDFDDNSHEHARFGLNQMLVSDPRTKSVRRFLVGPKGCEITGITKVPDGTALFVNVQHPGLSFPASDGKSRPRSSTILITKDDGGVVGT